ncbi:MAG: MFS transporter [Oscillospiraceae bacterium]|nr:MFS transporter [Oscillospiraceae bacterium]
MKLTTKILRNRNFSLLVAGKFMSIFANQVLTFSLPLYLLYATGSPALFGSVLGLSFLPFIVTSPIAGIMADRYQKQRIMFWLDVAVTAIVTVYMIISGMFATVAPIVLIKLIALNAIQGMYTPTSQACVPFLVPEGKLIRANSILETVNTLSNMAAPPTAGILLAGFGLFPILVVCAICFAITAVMDLLIRVPYKKQQASGNVMQIITSDMAQAFRFVSKHPTLIKLAILMFVLSALIPGVFNVGVPVLVIQHLGMDAVHLGTGRAIAWVGGILGGIIAGSLGEKLTLKSIPVTSIMLGFSIVPIGFAVWMDIPYFTAFAIIVASDFVSGLALILWSIPIWAYIQTIVPPELIGKVMSLFSGLPMIAMGLGLLLFGMLFERFSFVPWHVIFVTSFICCITVLLLRKHFNTIQLVANAT